MLPTISVIIPCYNSGAYLNDAILSVEKFPDKNVYEIIIVNDGSTDTETLNLLKNIEKTLHKVVNQENKGPAAARNTGVKNSRGKYLLFLDSDNKIKTDYISKGIEVLDSYKDVGVVYGNPTFFGGDYGALFSPREFDLNSIAHSNYIDTCTVVRKNVWEDVGGFDESRRLSQEDWDFWIRVGKTKWKFYYINEVLFEYRRRRDSHAMKSLEESEHKQLLHYVYSKHIELFTENYLNMSYELEKYKRERRQPIRTIVKYVYFKLTKKVLRRFHKD